MPENSRMMGMSPRITLRLPMISTRAINTDARAATWDGPSRSRCTTVRDCWAPVLKRAAPSPTVPRTNAVTRADPPTWSLRISVSGDRRNPLTWRRIASDLGRWATFQVHARATSAARTQRNANRLRIKSPSENNTAWGSTRARWAPE